jgi:hypothetical protein
MISRLTSSLLILVLLFTPLLIAQETRATVHGQIVDPNGAAIPDAEITITNTGTNNSTRTKSNEEGLYEVPFLMPGEYDVTAAKDGFSRKIRRGITLSVGGRSEVNISLEVGSADVSVTVLGDEPLLQTSGSSAGQVIDSRRVAELPSLFNNSMSLVVTVPGMQSANGINHSDPRSHGSGSDYTTSGGAATTNEWSLDGAPNQGRAGRNAYMPYTDAISEVKVETSPFDARLGHSSGAFVSMLSKSGTNRYHGSLTGTYLNQRWNAARREDVNAFNLDIIRAEAAGNFERANFLRSQPKVPAGRSYTGAASIGGPIYLPRFGEGGPALFNGKDKLFFFFTYNRLDQKLVAGMSHRNFTVPTEAMRGGDFSGLLRLRNPQLAADRAATDAAGKFTLYNPFSTTAVTAGGSTEYRRTPFPNNTIPAALLQDHPLRYYDRFYPLPNFPSFTQWDNTRNYFYSNVPSGFPYDSVQNRIDFNATEKDKFFGRWNYFTSSEINEDWTAETYPGLHCLCKLRTNRGLTLDYVRTFNPTTILNVTASYGEYTEGNLRDLQNAFRPSDVGLPSYLDEYAGGGHTLPILSFSAFKTVGEPISDVEKTGVGNLKVLVHKYIDKHGLIFGWDGRQYRRTGGALGNTSGSFLFDTSLISKDSTSASNSAIDRQLAWAAYLLGLPSAMVIEKRENYRTESPFHAFFVQDSFRVNSRLTLDLGLRLEYNGSIRERYNRGIRNFDFNAQLPIAQAVQSAYARRPVPELPASQFVVRGGSAFLGEGVPETIAEPSYSLMPRLGLAYQLNDKTVLRAGYGKFFDAFDAANIGTGSGFSQLGYVRETRNVITNEMLANGTITASRLPVFDPFPLRPDGSRFDSITGSSFGASTILGQELRFTDPDYKPAHQHRWRLEIQRQLTRDMMVSVAYQGSIAKNLPLTVNLNALPEQYWAFASSRNDASSRQVAPLSQNVDNPFFIGNLSSLRTQNPELYNQLAQRTLFSQQRISRDRLLRPYPHLSGLFMERSPLGENRHHSMILSFEKRMTKSWTLNTHYEYSRTRDKDWFQNEFDTEPQWRVSNATRPHRWMATTIWELPFGEGKYFFKESGIGRAIFGGWQIGAIALIQSGAALEFPNAFFKGSDYREILLDEGQKTPDMWFNNSNSLWARSSNELPIAFYARNFPSRFNWLRAPVRRELDANIQKIFWQTEALKASFRLDVINLLNHQSWGAPNMNPSSAEFGRILSSQILPRNLQYQLRLTF